MIDTKKLRKTIATYDVGPFVSNIMELIDELDRVTAERDALKVDAERYRAIREFNIRASAGIFVSDGNNPMYESRLDERIEAAIRASKGDA